MGRRLWITAIALLASLALTSVARADRLDDLLAPESVCPGQSDVSLPVKTQVAAMRCMHGYARQEAGRQRLRKNHDLGYSARHKARDIRRCQSFSHTACGRDAFYWPQKAGYLTGAWGAAENLAYGSSGSGSPRVMMSAWLHSEEHRDSLLDPNYRELGIGMVRGSYKGTPDVEFWVAHFGYHG
jgi:uncharacterized protein YkwD